MYPVLGTVSKYPLPTFHLAADPSLDCHADKSFPSNKTTASEGAFPTKSCVLAAPLLTTVGAGLFMSCAFHCVCRAPTTPQQINPALTPNKSRLFIVSAPLSTNRNCLPKYSKQVPTIRRNCHSEGIRRGCPISDSGRAGKNLNVSITSSTPPT